VPSVSVNEYQWKLGSKRAYHAMNWWIMALYRWSCSFDCVWLRAKETEITTAWGSVSSLLIYSFTSFLTCAALLSGHHHCRCFTSWHSVVRPSHCNWIHCLPRASAAVVNIQLVIHVRDLVIGPSLFTNSTCLHACSGGKTELKSVQSFALINCCSVCEMWHCEFKQMTQSYVKKIVKSVDGVLW